MKEIINSRILIDTDVIIDHFRGNESFGLLISDQSQNICYISVITIAEIYSLIYSHEYELVEKLANQLHVLNIDVQIAKLAGAYRMTYYKSHALNIPDGLIAATAKINDLILVSKNIRHFPMDDIIKTRPY